MMRSWRWALRSLHVDSGAPRRRGPMPVALIVPALLLAACSPGPQSPQPDRELPGLAQPQGSIYAGWRVFQDRCAGCHGAAASGPAAAPDLLPRMRETSPREFVGIVLMRYEWGSAVAPAGTDGAVREGLIDDVVQRRQGLLTMPEWEGEPSVNAHIMDLYAYLAARAEGSQGPGRPPN
jgi:mono/diheme cytochrome c family protein